MRFRELRLHTLSLMTGAILLAGVGSATNLEPTPNLTPYDGCGMLVQGTTCVLYQADNGNLYSIVDGNGSFHVGDYVHVVGDEGPCFSNCNHGGGCIFNLIMIESCLSDPTTYYCSGDGSGATCPCGNQGAAGAGCVNSTGLGGSLVGLGTASVSSDDLTLHTLQLPANKPSLLFSGTSAISNGIPFGDGLRCAGGNIKRLGTRIANSQGEATWGPGLVANVGWNAGETAYFQVWYRDPNSGPCNTGFNLTQGSSLVFTP